MHTSILNYIDFYKADHRSQYPKGTTKVFSNFTPRSSRIEGIDKVVFFGLQYYIREYLVNRWTNSFFYQSKEQVLSAYSRRMKNAFIDITVEHIEALHDLGYLPIEISALPEGKSVPLRVPMFTITNTDPDFYWLTNYLETQISACLWQACTSATIAKEYKKIFLDAMKRSGGPEDFVTFMGHDFSFRGMSSIESAEISGAAHLLSFQGTDTVAAIDFLEKYYNADSDKELIGCSVPATEHSVQCMGSKENEFNTYKRLITEVYPHGIVSIVSDTWDYWNVWTNILPELKDEILKRAENSPYPVNKVVIRPDSGDPVKIICGEEYDTFSDLETAKKCIISDMFQYAMNDHTSKPGLYDYKIAIKTEDDQKFYSIIVAFNLNRKEDGTSYVSEWVITQLDEYEPTPEQKGSFQLAWEVFGGKVNDEGFKELHPAIGLIYGDSITLERARAITDKLIRKGFVPSMVFGIGSFTYQYNTRDTFGFAMKSTYGEINDEPVEIFKDPVTDNGTKKSAKGLTSVLLDENNEYYLKDQCTKNQYYSDENQLKLVFKDGKSLIEESLSDIRKRVG